MDAVDVSSPAKPDHPGVRLGSRIAVLLLALALGALAWRLGHGVRGVAYLALMAAWSGPGWPLAACVFGPRHPATWIAGAALGYLLTAVLLWIPIAAGLPSPGAFVAIWLLGTGVLWSVLWPLRAARVALPRWSRRDTLALVVVLSLVPLLVARPFSRIGERDANGDRLFRAYFTADFLWHMALTAELEKFTSPPRNPYRANDTLHYYWLHFVPPSVAAGVLPHALPDRIGRLAINALGTGLIFYGVIFLFAWTTCGGRAGPAGLAAALGVAAASAEGFYLLQRHLRAGVPVALIREVNVDAVTAWFFRSFTIDGLPRSLWYNPHHSMACAAGLVALTIAARAGSGMTRGVAAVSGTALGLSLMTSPFPGGVIGLSWGLALTADLLAAWRQIPRRLLALAPAAIPVAAAAAWMVFARVLEGAGDNLRIGLSPRAATNSFTALGLAAGPLLLPALAGVWANWRLPRAIRPAAMAVAVSLLMIFFVSLRSVDTWVGWRAGQVMFVTAPALGAAGFAALAVRHRAGALALAAAVLAAGLPTTVLDEFNAQDVETRTMGPGFAWTVAVTGGEQEALDWVRRHTKPRDVVQVEPTVRGRETWTLIPSFAERRMAAGLPISLLDEPAYHEASDRVRELFATPDPDLAFRIAREMRIKYLYVDRVEAEHYPEADAKFERRPDLFMRVFQNADVHIFYVQ